MIVYHGGIDVIKKPDINHSYRPLDFIRWKSKANIKEEHWWTLINIEYPST